MTDVSAENQALEPAKNTNLATFDDFLTKQAKKFSQKIHKPSSNSIRLTNKAFKFPDGTIIPDEMNFVILEANFRNLYYEGRFDPKNPSPPSCFAIGENEEIMMPSENAPKAQNDKCLTCPNNEFGSGPGGSGKACKNTVMLAVTPADLDDDEVYTISVPPTSLKNWNTFTNAMKRLYGNEQAHPMRVVTNISFDRNSPHEVLLFKMAEQNQNGPAHMQLHDEAVEKLNLEPKLEAPKEKSKGKGKGRQ